MCYSLLQLSRMLYMYAYHKTYANTEKKISSKKKKIISNLNRKKTTLLAPS